MIFDFTILYFIITLKVDLGKKRGWTLKCDVALKMSPFEDFLIFWTVFFSRIFFKFKDPQRSCVLIKILSQEDGLRVFFSQTQIF